MKLRALLVLIGLFCITGAWAQNVLYWSDYDLGTNAVYAALGDLGWSTTVATDAADFNTKLGAGGWDVSCLLIQNYSTPYGTGWATAFGNVDSYLAGGGKMVFTDWTRDATRGASFGVTYTGNNNQDPIALAGPFGTGTLDLNNPGWGTFSMGMALNGASSAGTFGNGDIGIAYTNNTVINGWLKDTAADAVVGKGVAKAELEYLVNGDGDGQATPELSTWMLLACSGLAGVVGLRRRRKS